MTSGGNNFSRTLQDLKPQFPGLSRTKVIFQDFSGPGILKKKIQDFQGSVGILWEAVFSEFIMKTTAIQPVSDTMQFNTSHKYSVDGSFFAGHVTLC